MKLHEGEHIIAEIHRNWLPVVVQVFALILLGIAPFVIEGFLSNASSTIADGISHYTSHIVILEAAWILILWMVFAVIWTDHYLDVLIITNQRIIDIDQIALFERDFAELSIANIEDIRIEMNGVLAHWLKFGMLELQTAAESKSFVISNLQDPERARELISRAHAEYLKTQGQL